MFAPVFVLRSARRASLAPWLWLSILLAGCGGGTTGNGVAPGDDAASSDDSAIAEVGGDDAGSDTASSVPPPERLACVSSSRLASGLPTSTYGAVEADLIAIIPPYSSVNCPSDSGHVHLQLDISGKRYDVAINVESTTGDQVSILTKDLPAGQLPAEGFSNVGFSYVNTLGVHSTEFTAMSKSALVAKLQSELANASRVAIHGLTYSDGTGIHDIHKNGGTNHDGAVVVHGGGAGGADHVLAFRFSSDVF